MNKPTVTVGIPAYNEENIAELLKSVLAQNEKNITIVEIVVISDGSTDETVSLAKSVKDKRIKVKEYKTRVGKSFHLNTLFKTAQGEFIVLFDADVVLGNKKTINNLLQPLLKNRKVGLVGGETLPYPSRNFFERAVNIGIDAYSPLRMTFKQGNNVFNCIGQVLALRKKFAKSVFVPIDMIANDQFLYFSCISKKWSFEHAKSAVILYRSPTKIHDFVRQSKRFYAARKRLMKLFGKLAIHEYKMPKQFSFQTKLKKVLKHPLHASFIFTLNMYCALTGKLGEIHMNAKWPIAITTKKRIMYE